MNKKYTPNYYWAAPLLFAGLLTGCSSIIQSHDNRPLTQAYTSATHDPLMYGQSKPPARELLDEKSPPTITKK